MVWYTVVDTVLLVLVIVLVVLVDQVEAQVEAVDLWWWRFCTTTWRTWRFWISRIW